MFLDMLGFEKMDKITDTIFLGNYSAAESVDELKKEGIKKILCVMDQEGPIYPKDEFNYKKFQIADFPGQNIFKYFKECFNFIQGNDKILVHCMAGASRSATIVIGYLMWSQKMSFDDALNFVQSKRRIVSPNYGFIEQLKQLGEELKDKQYDLEKISFDKFIWDKYPSSYYWL